MISVAVRHRLGSFTLDAAFDSAGGVTALFGRSGAGKTTLINAIAGLLRPERGRIVVDGDVLTDTERGIFVPARRRRIGYVFQEGRLFPASDGAAKPALRTLVRAESRARGGDVDQVVALLGIGALLGPAAGQSVGRREAARRDRPRACWRARACW